MNRFKIIFSATTVISIILVLCSYTNYKNNDNIESVIVQRLNILTHFYENKANCEETKEKLKLIECDQLLDDDVNNLYKYKNTDIEKIEDFKLLYINQTVDKWNNYYGDYTVKWVIKSNLGYQEEQIKYSFAAKKENKNIKLTNINIIK